MRKRRSIARFATKTGKKRTRGISGKSRIRSRRKKGIKAYVFTKPPNHSFLLNELRAAQTIVGEAVQQDREVIGQPILSVIIPAMNEERTIAAVVREAARICRDAEVLVIVNGSSDGTASEAERAGARVLQYSEALGHDGGRRVGAAAAQGQILLFTDADIPIPAEHLAPYVQAVLNGVDIALNDYNGPVTRIPVHPVVEAKHMLNSLLSRSDLGGASMTAIPHALSRKALEIIGISSLEIPPLAHAKAVLGGLRVQAVHHVPVGKWNAVRIKKRSGADPLSQVVLQDHLEAIRWIIDTQGPRGGYTDLERVRSLAQ
ncbi:glycosyltransferase family 2 protein [Paenibacillus amylolyticus]|uniref:glycosyltransferase family 2 protein n=1 Tax=Paenibacillus amylolyticus TaxID=1451 RepID=UPI003EC11167